MGQPEARRHIRGLPELDGHTLSLLVAETRTVRCTSMIAGPTLPATFL